MTASVLQKIKSDKVQCFRIVVFLAWLAVNILLLARHEMWRDEINVWLFVRDVPLEDFFSELRFQGHPCLWYLLILPFARLGFPCQIMGVISLCIMGTAGALFLWKAPVCEWVKAITLFLPAFTYYYSVISRAYCLVALLILLLAVFYQKRNEKPLQYGLLLGLLVQADTIGIPVAGMISAMWVMENLWESYCTRSAKAVITAVKGVWIPLISVILWFLQFYDMGESTIYTPQDMGLRQLVSEIKNYTYYMLERLTYLDSKAGVVIFWVCMVAVALMAVALKTAWPFLVMAASVVFQAAFSCLMYQLRVYHFIMLFFAYIWMLWIYGERLYQLREKLPEKKLWPGNMGFGILQFLFLAVLLFTFRRWITEDAYMGWKVDWYHRMSDGKYAAEYVEENISSEELIICAEVSHVASMQGYLPEYDFYFAGSGNIVSYADWTNEQSQKITYEALTAWINREFPETESFIYVAGPEDYVEGEEEALAAGDLLYETEIPSTMNENYRIYRIYL